MYKDEIKDCISTYQEFLIEKGEYDSFILSLKKDQDYSLEKSSFEGTISLHESFDNDNINNSFLSSFIENDREKEDFKFFSDIVISSNQKNYIKKEKKINKKKIIFNDISLYSRSSEIGNKSYKSNKDKIFLIQNTDIIREKYIITDNYYNNIKKKLDKIGYNSIRLYIGKNKKKSNFLAKRKKRLRNKIINKNIMIIKYINYLLAEKFVNDKVLNKIINNNGDKKILLFQVFKGLISKYNLFCYINNINTHNNPFNNLKYKFLIWLFKMYKFDK
jgi:hypothetical protein